MMRFVRYGSVILLLAAACLMPLLLHRDNERPPLAAPVCVRLLFVGDVMQHMPQVEAARRAEGFDYAPVFAAVRPHFEAADLVTVNLETTLTRSGRYAGYPCFRSPMELASAMHDAGVDVAVMANNHCCDGGVKGVQATCEELDRLAIRRTGVFKDSLDRVQHHPLIVARRGISFALLNYTYSTNGIPAPQGVAVNAIDTIPMAADLRAARSAGAECVVVFIHWGEEYQRYPNAEQRRLARFLRSNGADVVIGSHPHVIQPFEVDSSGVVFYSLGNFVSNQRKRYTDGGLIARVDVTRHRSGRLTYAAKAIPVWVALPGYRILPPEAADTMVLPPAYATFRRDVAELLGVGL